MANKWAAAEKSNHESDVKPSLPVLVATDVAARGIDVDAIFLERTFRADEGITAEPPGGKRPRAKGR